MLSASAFFVLSIRFHYFQRCRSALSNIERLNDENSPTINQKNELLADFVSFMESSDSTFRMVLLTTHFLDIENRRDGKYDMTEALDTVRTIENELERVSSQFAEFDKSIQDKIYFTSDLITATTRLIDFSEVAIKATTNHQLDEVREAKTFVDHFFPYVSYT